MGGRDMRVLVTGHLGYIGVVLAPLLQKAGHDVVGLDINLYRGCDFGPAAPTVPTIIGDVRDVTADQLEGFDAIIHLAALSNDPLGDIDPDLTEDINFRATVRLAEAAKAAGVERFVFSSSCSNYGASKGGWLDEMSPLNPVTPYAVSKMRSEEALDKLADDTFCPIYLRSGTAYGLSSRLRFDLVVNNLTAWAIATGQVRLKSDGRAWRPLVHAQDMAAAFELMLTTDRSLVHRQPFNVGRNEDCMQVRDIANIVAEEVPSAAVTFAEGHSADQRTYQVDCSKIGLIGFRPKWDVRRGVIELRDAFQTYGAAVSEFEGTKYQRVARVSHLMASGEVDGKLRRLKEWAA
jgi:nucleoside-diphosphate-sugar epimerase